MHRTRHCESKADIFEVFCRPFESLNDVASSTISNLFEELKTAQDIVEFLRDEADAGNDNHGAIFASWLTALIPTDEVTRMYRPWNRSGVPGSAYSNAQFTPLEFLSETSGPMADSRDSGAPQCAAISPKITSSIEIDDKVL